MGDYDPDDPVAVYVREVSTLAPLAKDEELQLFRQLAGAGDWDPSKGKCCKKINRRSFGAGREHCQKALRIGNSDVGFDPGEQQRPIERCKELC